MSLIWRTSAIKIEFVEGDIRDKDLVDELVKGKDYIFNFAAQVSYIDSKDEPFLDLDINGRGHLNVLEAMREHNPGAKVLFFVIPLGLRQD